jgi:hypothetical protein
MAGPGPSATERLRREQNRLRRQLTIVIGVVFTFVGLFLIAALLPVGAPGLARAVPLAGAGVLAVWVGGILLGRGTRSRAAPPIGGT